MTQKETRIVRMLENYRHKDRHSVRAVVLFATLFALNACQNVSVPPSDNPAPTTAEPSRAESAGHAEVAA